ncbi:MAG: hypothetical protein CME34_04965 [Gordonia sp.]|uniref:DEAD/DEAH box helicase n=1 Tax=Gordonia sp. (in: high G+C Gram-positive bacteria) TaxID=84139 RepID=UPI000C4D75F4|nr:DEAD/DEAH box helicase family protein [Gordonia sp. (in: high G+C Gram-positive bacteria)]MAU81216.1 hypothetical protein [Gordonia sp. (in: high G+C Gram-positive bacteria)]
MSVFSELEVTVSGLRECQIRACEAAKNHYAQESADNHTLIQLPTGTGKSGLIAALPFALDAERVLVLVPNLHLVTQMVSDLDTIDEPTSNAYKKFSILTDDQIDKAEIYVMPLNSKANRTDIEQHQIIVANYQQVADIEKWFGANNDLIDLIIIDEAHHQAAKTYQQLIQFFDSARIVGLTATPFRSDGRKVDGESIYIYHFSDAVKMGYIRNIKVSNVSPQEVTLLFTESGGTETYTLEQMINGGIKEEAWFNRGIALSEECCESIADLAVEKLRNLKSRFPETDHQIIAAAMSIRHAREFIKPAFERHGLKVGMVSSDRQDLPTNDKTKAQLKQGKIDVIINVGMLGEGFNQPTLGVAAIFRPFKSLNPYIQFIGRVLRENRPASYCYVVSHLGLNQVRRFEEFKLFDSDDQLFIEGLFVEDSSDPTSDRSFLDDDTTDGSSENSDLGIRITQSGELSDISASFVDEDKIGKINDQYNKLTPDERATFLSQLGIDGGDITKIKPKKIKPIQQRLAQKNKLNEHVKSITTDILREVDVQPYGRDFNPRDKNFTWVQKQVNRWVNSALGIKSNQRNQLSLAQLQEFESSGEISKLTEKGIEHYRKALANKK